jgi:hypothetical protein
MPKPNGTPGKKPPAPSIKVRLGQNALSKPRHANDSELGRLDPKKKGDREDRPCAPFIMTKSQLGLDLVEDFQCALDEGFHVRLVSKHALSPPLMAAMVPLMTAMVPSAMVVAIVIAMAPPDGRDALSRKIESLSCVLCARPRRWKPSAGQLRRQSEMPRRVARFHLEFRTFASTAPD